MTVQNHIHLDFETMPLDADGAPPQRWTIVDLQPRPTIRIGVNRSTSGYTYITRVLDAVNDPVVHNDVDMIIRTDASGYALLLSMLGHYLYFVPNDHVDDGEDHLGYIRQVVIKEMQPQPVDAMLRKWNITVSLVDRTQPGARNKFSSASMYAVTGTSLPALYGAMVLMETEMYAVAGTATAVLGITRSIGASMYALSGTAEATLLVSINKTATMLAETSTSVPDLTIG